MSGYLPSGLEKYNTLTKFSTFRVVMHLKVRMLLMKVQDGER